MSAGSDKRSVTTDALETLGTLIDENQKRDAIHLAVEPVMAGEILFPGQHITVALSIATATEPGKGLGIVDPFLVGAVKKGEMFWFVMYPRQVKSLRHVWTHPAFPDEPQRRPLIEAEETKVAGSAKWIKQYADSLGLGSRSLMEGAEEWLTHGEYLNAGEILDGVSLGDEFWTHYEIVTGKAVPESKRGSFFSCSC